MPRTTAEKLHIKPASRLFFAGDSTKLRQLLEPLPDDTTIGKTARTADVAILFTTSRS